MALNRTIWILTGVFALARTAVQAQVSDARIRELIRQAAEKVSQTDASVQPPVAGAAAQARPVVRLTLDEAVKLTLDRNLDIAVQRYGPFLAREILRRTEGGGILRNADTPIAAGPTSVSTAGISSNDGPTATADQRRVRPTPYRRPIQPAVKAPTSRPRFAHDNITPISVADRSRLRTK